MAAPALAAVMAPESRAAPPQLSHVQGMYVERCGGCHGIQGVSAPQNVPDLRGQAGFFLCTREGRDYLIRLPNVALVALSDVDLAALMNFVAKDLGRAGQSDLASPYTPEEVHRLRADPLRQPGLVAYRKTIVEGLRSTCGAPKSLLQYNITAQ